IAGKTGINSERRLSGVSAGAPSASGCMRPSFLTTGGDPTDRCKSDARRSHIARNSASMGSVSRDAAPASTAGSVGAVSIHTLPQQFDCLTVLTLVSGCFTFWKRQDHTRPTKIGTRVTGIGTFGRTHVRCLVLGAGGAVPGAGCWVLGAGCWCCARCWVPGDRLLVLPVSNP